mgnify:CR=1 FL=1
MSRIEKWNPFGVSEWVAWVGATVAAAVSITVFAFSNFETKERAVEVKSDLVQRLDRIEGKVDKILQK